MTKALAQQRTSVVEGLAPVVAAGLLARTALALANRRMGGREPPPRLENEGELRERLVLDARHRLGISGDDQSPEALLAIEAALDEERESVRPPIDYVAAYRRIEASGILDPDRPRGC